MTSVSTFANDDDIHIADITFSGDTLTHNTHLVIQGSGFGGNKNDIQVYVNNTKLTVIDVLDREITLDITQQTHSGSFWVERSFELSGKVYTKSSNRFPFVVGEAVIRSLEYPHGMISGEELIVYGERLDNALFWCDNHKFIIKQATSVRATLEIPSVHMSCSFEALRNEFITKTPHKIKVAPSVSIDAVEHVIHQGKEYIRLLGKGFFLYSSEKASMKLSFMYKDLVSSLHTYTFISDTELRFLKNSTLPYTGMATLSIENTDFPSIEYTMYSDFPTVISLQYEGYAPDFDFAYTINTSPRDTYEQKLQPIATSYSPAIKINGSTRPIAKAFPFVVGTTQPIPPSGMLIFEHFGFYDVLVYQNITHYLPSVHTVKFLDTTRHGEAKLEFLGHHFGSEKHFSFQSSLSEVEILQFAQEKILFKLPILTDAQTEWGITLKNAFGSTERMTIPLDKEAGELFRFTPEIDKITYPFGAFVGGEMHIEGKYFEQVKHIVVGKQSYPVSPERKMIRFSVPKNFPPTGNISLMTHDFIRSQPKAYDVTQAPPSDFSFLVFDTSDTKNVYTLSSENPEIYRFSVTNLAQETSATLLFSIRCARGCTLHPFQTLKLIDVATKKEVSTLQYSHANKTVTLRFRLPVSITQSTYAIHATSPKMVSQPIELSIHDMSFMFSPSVPVKEFHTFSSKVFIPANKTSMCVIIRDNTESLCHEDSSSQEKEQDSIKIEVPSDQNESQIVKTEEVIQEEVLQERKEENVLDEAVSIPALTKQTEAEAKKPQPSSPTFSHRSFAPVYRKPRHFEDAQDHWAKQYLDDLYARGVFQGTVEGKSELQRVITRAEIVALVLRLRNEAWNTYAVRHFDDTHSHWAGDMLEYALEKKYIHLSTRFYPDAIVTRAEAVAFLMKMFALPVYSTPHTFTDIDGHYAENQIITFYTLGILQGKTELLFAPDDTITRGELAKILSLLIAHYDS